MDLPRWLLLERAGDRMSDFIEMLPLLRSSTEEFDRDFR
jgi:hypothetical protein